MKKDGCLEDNHKFKKVRKRRMERKMEWMENE